MPAIETIQKLALATEEDEPVLSIAIMLAALTGARRAEILGLRWSDLDRVGLVLTIQRSAQRGARHSVTMGPTKNRTIRWLTIDEVTLAALDLHRERCEKWADDGGVLLGPDSYMVSMDPSGCALINSPTRTRRPSIEAKGRHSTSPASAATAADENSPTSR